MADIILTTADNNTISSALSILGSTINLFGLTSDTMGFRVGALRYAIGWTERSPSNKSTAADRYKITLCKLVATLPQSVSDEYIVLKRLPDGFAAKYPALGSLLSVYGIRSYNSGSGFWPNRVHENVMLQIHSGVTAGQSPVFINRVALRAMMAAYKKQQLSASAEGPASQDLRARLADDAAVLTQADRKRRASDVHGKCYNCGAPKPRKVSCLVCGYMPRGT